MQILFKAFIVFLSVSIVAGFSQAESVGTYGRMSLLCADSIPSIQQVDSVAKAIFLNHFFLTPLHFIANHGQINETVIYYARSEGGIVYCTDQGLVFGTPEGNVGLRFAEGRYTRPQARSELQGKINYLIGNDPELWRTDIPAFREVIYPSVYPGIDLVYSGNQKRLKYTFYLQPGADPHEIRMIYEGMESLWIDEETGELVIQTGWGEMRDVAPVAYQEIEGIRRDIDISFCLIGESQIGFAVGDYDADSGLVLDPELKLPYSTYLGGSGGEDALGIAADDLGNAYVTGYTWSFDFPTRNPLPGMNPPGSFIYDAFVTKIDTTKSGNDSLIYSTFLGGDDDDWGNGIAIDGVGNAYIAGTTISDNFPTVHPHQDTPEGNGDAFAAKLSSAGNQLIYSTYLGTDDPEMGHDIAVDNQGDAYLVGTRQYPAPPGSDKFDSDVLVARLSDRNLSSFPPGVDEPIELLYLVYLGGSAIDEGFGIAVDNQENAYVTGETRSEDFTLTPDAYQTEFGGICDAFVAKLGGTGTLIYSTFLGGTNWDGGEGIAGDNFGRAYVAGYTSEYESDESPANFPIKSAFQGTYGGGDLDAVVAKIDTTKSGEASLVYSTYLGGNDIDSGYGIAVDDSGNAYITGETGSGNFHTTSNAYQQVKKEYLDAFVSMLSSTGRQLMYSSFLGGSDADTSADIAIDNSGDAYITGTTHSTDFPTQSPYQGERSQNYWDAFVSRLHIESPPGMGIEVFSPVDVVVTDPMGRTISKTNSEIPSATYVEEDINGDGEPDDRVIIPDAMVGNYLIEVVPEQGADPTDTYTMDVIFGSEVVTLAEDVQVQDIPSESYVFFFPLFRLKEGWNLISLPLTPPNTDPGAVLSSVQGKYDSVWAYNPQTSWLIYIPGGTSDLVSMEPNAGYWIKMNEEGVLAIEGTAPEQTAIFLEGEKWNLVGYSTLEYRDPEDCMSSVEDDIDSVWEYDPDQEWSIYAPGGASDLEVMRPMYGYWIKANRGCTWDVNEGNP